MSSPISQNWSYVMIKHAGTAFALIAATLLAAQSPAIAQCDDSQALGTSRVLTANPRRFPQVGRAQYRESLPLRRGEVVLTFDNGPSYPYTEAILKTLAAECVKATFFALGSNVVEDPEQIRRIAQEGHSIGAQTFNHVALTSLALEEANKEIDDGINALNSALRNSVRISFFRAPMLELSPQLARNIISRGMMVWSIDVDSQDWNDISEEQIVEAIMKGLDRFGGGIVAMQDIQPATARALPLLLARLKERKYRIVHVAPPQPQTNAGAKNARASRK
jgi:peptidoglycan/xylan/chitin deacetylase (PgdA/CDA1 family)